MPRSPRRPAPPPLVERGTELAALELLLAELDAGHGSCVCVLGPAGMGKTSLVRALAYRATAGRCRTWLTSAGELDGRVPFGVVRRLLDQPVRDLTATRRRSLEAGPARRALSHLWGGAPVPLEPTGQGDMLHSLAWLLDALVASVPAALIVDDAQWADEESLIFLGSLREHLHHTPLAVVVAARDERWANGRGLARLVADPDAVVLRLGPLSRTGVDAVLDARWPGVGDATAAAVHEVTDGNPFLVTALIDALGDRADTLDADVVRATIPASVVDLILARLSVLSSPAQLLARAVAVLGSASTAVAAALAGISIERAGEAADHLRRIGLLGDASDLEYRHALLRSAVEATIGPDTRDQLHRTAARLLDDSDGQGRQRAAAHLLASAGVGDPWAVALLRDAAADAMCLGAPQSAASLLRRAVDEPADADALPALLAALGSAQIRMLDPAGIETLRRAERLMADPVSRARCSLELANALEFAGLHDQAASVLAEGRQRVAGHDRELELTLDATWASVSLLVPGEVDAARARLKRLADVAGLTVGERRILVQQLCVAAETNQPADVVRELAARVTAGRTPSEELPETGDWVWPVAFLARIGDFDDARRLCDEGLAHAQVHGSVIGEMTAAFGRGFTELDAGALVQAEGWFRRMVAASSGSGAGPLVATLGYGGLAQSLALQGRVEEAAAVLAPLPSTLPAQASITGTSMVWLARSLSRYAAGDHVGAVEAARSLAQVGSRIGIDSPLWAAWRPVIVRPLRELGRLDEARALVDEHSALCSASAVPHLVGESLCLAASVAADADERIELATRGVELLAGTGSTWRHGIGCLTLGALLRRAGRKADARDPLSAAARLLTVSGALGTAQVARAELAATGARLSRARDRRLTPSEIRIVRLVLAGLSNPEIAARLHLSRKTVETHLSSVYRKLEVDGRMQLTPEHVTEQGAEQGADG